MMYVIAGIALTITVLTLIRYWPATRHHCWACGTDHPTAARLLAHMKTAHVE